MKTMNSNKTGWFALLICFLCAGELLAQDRSEMFRRMMSGRTGTSSVQRQSSQVVAVADERSNSVIVIASTNIHNEIEALIRQIDSNVDDVTEVRVFPLKNADPAEMSEVLTQLFAEQQASNNQQQGGGFRLPFFFGGRGGGNQQALRSDQRVVAVPDPRSTSIIVSAPRQMMDQIAQMIQQLDTSSGKRQQVFTYTLEHADVNNVQEILRAMFEGQNSRSARSQTQNNTSALTQRAGGFGTAGSTQGATQGGRGGGGGGAFGR